MTTSFLKALEIIALLLAGAGALAGQATESLTPLGAGLALAAACLALVAAGRRRSATT